MPGIFYLALVLTLLYAFLLLGSTGVAAAAEETTYAGPHGVYGMVSAKCAYCHRPHTGLRQKQLKGDNVTDLNFNSLIDIADFCLSCHKDGLGANNDVWNGVFRGTYTGFGTQNYGSADAGLNGGGFAYAKPYTGISNRTGSSEAVTSRHDALSDTNTYTMWGSGNAGPGAVVNITCVSCHNPHGTGNYRLLRSNGPAKDPETAPNPWPAAGSVRSNEEQFGGSQPKNYTAINYRQGIASFCTVCHKQYKTYKGVSGDANGSYDTGDGKGALVRYRHPIEASLDAWDFFATKSIPDNINNGIYIPLEQSSYHATADPSDRLTCLTCHQVHGTAATMNSKINTYAGQTQLAASTGSLPGRSTLLRLNNRRVCENCHGWP